MNPNASWHGDYSTSSWIWVGGLDYRLTEGDVLSVFAQWGEIGEIKLARDEQTGRSKGFAFICYSNQLSTVLAVDNFNGISLLGRTLKVDHVLPCRIPK
jgi:RNA-binding motif X-linked protein 2